MFGKKFLIFFSILCLGIIFYTTYDLLTKKNLSEIESIFGKEDVEILIINRINEFQSSTINFNSKSLSFIESYLNNFNNATIITSKARNHLYIVADNIWDLNQIKKHFSGINVKRNNYNQFTVGTYKAISKKNILYLFETELKTSKMLDTWEDYDKKASSVIINFETSKPIITEIYQSDENTVNYITYNQERTNALKINDKDLFSIIIPDRAQNYHFYEKNYLMEIDSIFAISPLTQFINAGIVTFSYDDDVVLISDYQSGKQPDLILRENFPNMEFENPDQYTLTKSTSITDFKNDGDIFMKIVDDYVIISQKNDVINQVIADYKLGNTLAQNSTAQSKIFDRLPKNVSERFLTSNNTKKSISFANNSKFVAEANFSSGSKNLSDQKTYKLAAEGIVKDFVVLDETGEVAVINENNLLIYFHDGKKQWSLDLGSDNKLLGLKTIDIFENGKLQLLVSFNNSIHLIDVLGRYLPGFPLKSESQFKQEASFYAYNGNSFFTIPEDNYINVFNNKGDEINRIKTNITEFSYPMVTWISNKTLYYGAHSEDQFYMFDAKRSREYRKFQLSKPYIAVSNTNKLDFFSINNSQLLMTDQKGMKSNLATFKNSKILKQISQGNTQYLLLSQAKKIKVLNALGIEIKEFVNIESNINDIDYSQINKNHYLATLDGIQNDVYLRKNTQNKNTIVKFEGSKKVQLSSVSDKLLLTTIVDNFVIQYVENL